MSRYRRMSKLRVSTTASSASFRSQLSLHSMPRIILNLAIVVADQIVRAVRGEPLPIRTMVLVDFVARRSTRTVGETGSQTTQWSDFWSMPPREANLWLVRLGDIRDAEPHLKKFEGCPLVRVNSSLSAMALLGIAERARHLPACLRRHSLS